MDKMVTRGRLSIHLQEGPQLSKEWGEGHNICTANPPKKRILILVGHYLPGFKVGGPVRSVANLVEQLGKEYDFRVVTSDRDYGDRRPYPNMMPNRWHNVSGTPIFYFSPRSCSLWNIIKLLKRTTYDILYINSYFDPLFSIRILLAHKAGLLPKKPTIVAPRGELSDASLKIKPLKKAIFSQLARATGLYSKVIWQASSESEKIDIIKAMKISPHNIRIAANLPTLGYSPDSGESVMPIRFNSDGLRIVFLSRISREKNLDYALMTLCKVKSNVILDIFGPPEDKLYLNECLKLIDKLPKNVIATYRGDVRHNQVLHLLRQYDLFFLPSSGESYGHVIVESLLAGTPVLISTETPWRGLQNDGLGWDVRLTQMNRFVEIIDDLKRLEDNERMEKQVCIRKKALARLEYSAVLEKNRSLFRVN